MGGLGDLRGKRVYIDANIFIYAIELFEPHAEKVSLIWAMLDDGSIQAVTSELCLAECLGGPYRTGREDLASIYIDLIRDRPQLTVNAITREILIEAARLRSEVRTLRLPDAIHHATARIAACDILLTNDERFRGVARPEAVLLSDISIDG